MSDGINLEALVGQTIEAAYMSADGDLYLVLLNGRTYHLQGEGDCCANCWIADVDGAEALQVAEILSIEDLAIEDTEETTGDVVEQSWGHRIHTNRGICTIGMRLSHNGYYGGWLNVHLLKKLPGGLAPLRDFS
jgi:hypothetical protein